MFFGFSVVFFYGCSRVFLCFVLIFWIIIGKPAGNNKIQQFSTEVAFVGVC